VCEKKISPVELVYVCVLPLLVKYFNCNLKLNYKQAARTAAAGSWLSAELCCFLGARRALYAARGIRERPQLFQFAPIRPKALKLRYTFLQAFCCCMVLFTLRRCIRVLILVVDDVPLCW